MSEYCLDTGENGEPMYPATVKIVKARVLHRCNECQELIQPGDLYERIRGKYEGQWEEFKTCPTCLEIRRVFFNSFCLGNIWADLSYEDDLPLGNFLSLSPAAVDKIDRLWMQEVII